MGSWQDQSYRGVQLQRNAARCVAAADESEASCQPMRPFDRGAQCIAQPLGGGDDTVKFCKANGISYSAYSPLGGLTGTDVFKDPTVIAIGNKHNVGPAQVALRWLVQQNISVVTA